MKIFLIGAGGQLGREVIETCPTRINEKLFEFIPLDKNIFDLEDIDSCKNLVRNENPDWIINCAAFTKVDEAETQKNKAYLINGYAPKVLSKELSNLSGKFIQISTDFVFSGKQNYPYKIDQLTEPVNEYGKTKEIGEKAVLENLGFTNKGFVIRTSWLVSSVGSNFVLTMLRLLNEKSEINVVSDQIGCITSTNTLSKAIWKLIDIREKKITLPTIFHVSDNGIASWYDIAMEIYEIGSKLDLIKNNVRINPIKSKDYICKARRPAYSLLDCENSKNILGLEKIHWKESIKNILLEINNPKL